MRDALVVGAGPAGAALATRLARAGREVVLLERERGPADKVCGEFLSREAALCCARLEVDLRALGAVPIEAVRLREGARRVDAPLPFAAWSLSRRVFDEALLRRACAAGATVRRGAKVRELSRVGSRWTARLDDGVEVEAGEAFLATGKHDLRGYNRPPGLQNDLVAFKLHVRLAPAQAAELDGCVELVLFAGGYAGLQPIEGGRANLCLVVRGRRLRALGRRWADLLAKMRAESPHLDARLTGAEPCAARPLALSAIPYGHVRARGDGPWRLGDQAAVIPSFTGDGVSIALHSAELAAAVFLEGGDVDAYQRELAADVRSQVLLASALSHGLVRRSGQRCLFAAAALWPGLLVTVASHTRVRE
jgi:flavin-dependent dehydrogenase